MKPIATQRGCIPQWAAFVGSAVGTGVGSRVGQSPRSASAKEPPYLNRGFVGASTATDGAALGTSVGALVVGDHVGRCVSGPKQHSMK